MIQRPSLFPSLVPVERRVKTTSRDNQALPVTPFVSASLVDHLEERISTHEKTMADLLEQAFHIKEEIASALHGMHNKSRDHLTKHLLEEHIRNIIAIVKHLSKDIEVLQENIHIRDNINYGTSSAVKNLEMHQLSVLGDLRGRVARCDANISRLSADHKTIEDKLQNLSKEKQTAKVIMDSKIKDVEQQISQLLSRIDSATTDQETKLKLTQKEGNEQLYLLDMNCKGMTEDLKSQILSTRNWLEQEQERVEKELLQKIEELSLSIKENREMHERAVAEKFHQMSVRLGKIEEMQKPNVETHQMRRSVDKLNARITKVELLMNKEIKEIKAELNSGFAAIHESIGSLRQVLETKMKLDKDLLQKQIHQMKEGRNRT
ncbi:protein FAM81A [Microcaecilia unicolor]|uniref:Protein FAM81A n=1 Tax=Microcaecilia unicolor TaxID=1415580 RepID=A0A6P7WSY1_9AMPH|nr:protein FAM81A [Microcaecilia unicolor]XP_030046268.1 protein FAM81A [Microcaecilia unicolor]